MKSPLQRKYGWKYLVVLVSAAVVALGFAGCKPPDYPVTKILLTVDYIGSWSVLLKVGDAPIADSGPSQTYEFDETDAPFSFTIVKDGGATEMTVRLIRKTLWMSGETDAELSSSEEILVEEKTSTPNDTVSLEY